MEQKCTSGLVVDTTSVVGVVMVMVGGVGGRGTCVDIHATEQESTQYDANDKASRRTGRRRQLVPL